MPEYSFIEDAYIDFSNMILVNYDSIDSRDLAAINNFFIKLSNDDSLTEAQARYVLRLMSKYQSSMKKLGVDYSEILKAPRWKNDFRILDLTKRVFVIQSQEKLPIVCLKFPFAFRSTFEREFLFKLPNKIYCEWDHNQKINIIQLYDINLIVLNDFCLTYQFEIDDSFLQAMAQVEEIWENQSTIIPHSVIDNGKVLLKNITNDALQYWSEHSTGDYYKDLFLAKTMGMNLRIETIKDPIESIATSETSNFWMNDFKKFFDLYKKLDEKIAVILDSSKDTMSWLEEFVASADEMHVPRSEIKICFREDKGSNDRFNDWIKDNELGGKITSGKIFIFRNKPAKWMFGGDNNVKIAVTNELFPSMNLTTKKWLQSRPCTIHLGTIKASQIKGIEIVQL